MQLAIITRDVKHATKRAVRCMQNMRYNALNSEHSTGSVSRYTPFTRYNRVERTAVVRSTGCQTGFQTGLTTGWMFVYTIQPVWQQVVSCKRGFSFCYVVLAAFSLRHVKFGVLIIIVKLIMSRHLISSLFWRTKLANVLETSGRLSFLFQRISVLLQRYNSILLHDSFVREDCPE